MEALDFRVIMHDMQALIKKKISLSRMRKYYSGKSYFVVFNLDQVLATRTQKLQNRAARIITFQGYDVRSAQIRKQLNWEELASRRQRHLSLLMYDTVNGNIPSYLSDLFSNVCENNPYKSMLRNTEYNVLDQVPKTEYYKGSFSYRGGMLWNSLPNDIKASESKAIFKRKLASRQANC